MKRLVAAVLAGVFILAAGVGEASARSAARLRWEGAAITLGALGFIAVLDEVVRAQEAQVRVREPYGAYYGYDDRSDEGYGGYDDPHAPPPPPPGEYLEPVPDEQAPPPAPAPGRTWVPGHWFETEVWVPLTWRQVWVWDDDRRDHRDRRSYRPGSRDHRDRDRRDYRGGRYERRPFGGHFERRRVWRDGYYR